MTIGIFIIVLLLLVLAHEFGHFIMAKKTGMRVDEFGFGFPPKIFKKKIGETEYSICALPIGGFVKIYGEDALLKSEEERANDPDHERSFLSKSRTAQAAVLVAGVFMNVLLAWVMLSAVYVLGVKEIVAETDATEKSALTVMAVAPDSPASTAGIPVGAIIQSFTRGSITSELPMPSIFREFTATSDGEPITIRYEFDGVVSTANLIPKTGLIALDAERFAVGLSLALTEMNSYPIHVALARGLETTGSMLLAVSDGLLSFFGNILTGSADLRDVSGPIGLVSIVGDAARDGMTSLMRLTAFISLNLVVINLLPFPALDGGRLVFVAIEAIRRKAMPAKLVAYANTVGFLFLLALMVVVTVNDIMKLV